MHVEIADGVVRFHYVYERSGRCDRTVMEPARQCLDAAELAGPGIDLGLVIRPELIVPESCLNGALAFFALCDAVDHVLGQPYDVAVVSISTHSPAGTFSPSISKSSIFKRPVPELL